MPRVILLLAVLSCCACSSRSFSSAPDTGGAAGAAGFTGASGAAGEVGIDATGDSDLDANAEDTGSVDAGSDAAFDAAVDTRLEVDPPCADYIVTVTDFLDAPGEARTTIDASQLPGKPGSTERICLAFTTTNPASARTMMFGTQAFGMGPCNASAPQYNEACFDYVRPETDAEIVIKNESPGGGCQNGVMTDVQLIFTCR